jgi:hypothetical protein
VTTAYGRDFARVFRDYACPNKHNRCKQIVTHCIVEVMDLLVVGWVIVWPQEEKVTEGSGNSVMRLGTGFVVR